MSILEIMLGRSYVDENGVIVKITRQHTDKDADFEQGFRFRGDNGRNYTCCGGVTGYIGHAAIFQLGAAALVREHIEPEDITILPTLVVELGGFYRNGLEQVIMVVDVVDPESKYFEEGFRFIDVRNTYYKENGVCSDNVIFKTVNLLQKLDPDDVTTWEMAQIHRWADENLKRLDRQEAIRAFGRKVWRYRKPLSFGAVGGAIFAKVMGR